MTTLHRRPVRRDSSSHKMETTSRRYICQEVEWVGQDWDTDSRYPLGTGSLKNSRIPKLMDGCFGTRRENMVTGRQQ